MVRALVVLLGIGLANVAAAESVELLSSVPSAVAVSSTVDNASILPAHLVDGKLDTAWNSATGDLVGAWVAVRIPADARVETIKLTVGFTKIDPKYGDLFTMNPRIKRVRVTRDNAYIAEPTLDPDVRTLQDIPIGRAGGDYRLEVLEVVPGTKKTWREINISELQVWGKPGKTTPASPAKLVPVVHVGGFDHDDLTRAQCVAALLGKSAKVAQFATEDFSGDLSICRVEQASPHADGGATSGTATIGIVKRGAKPVLIAKLAPIAISTPANEPAMGEASKSATVAATAIALTTTEAGLLVTESSHEQGMQWANSAASVRLYRIGAAGALTKVLEYGWSNSESTNGGTTETCALDPPTPAAKLPAVLDVRCQVHHERYPGNPEDVTSDSERVDHYKWNGVAYAQP